MFAVYTNRVAFSLGIERQTLFNTDIMQPGIAEVIFVEKAMIGNKGYRKFVKMESGSISIDLEKIEEEAKYDGISVPDQRRSLP